MGKIATESKAFAKRTREYLNLANSLELKGNDTEIDLQAIEARLGDPQSGDDNRLLTVTVGSYRQRDNDITALIARVKELTVMLAMTVDDNDTLRKAIQTFLDGADEYEKTGKIEGITDVQG